MPAKKKAVKKKAPPTFEEAVLPIGADFACDECLKLAQELYAAHGPAFVAALKKHAKDAIPVSLMRKVIAVESAGGTVKLKARKSIKDKAE